MASHSSYMEGNAFEALVGAIYLDRGYGACMRFMQKRILSQLINLDKVAYKEVNFKSKLIEWCQKNKVKLDFELVEQQRDNSNSPMFVYKAKIEGIEGGEGRGYSKKESQQTASKTALQNLRRQPQFIDAVFAAKTERTKMEEEPVETVPDVETKDDFIIAAADETIFNDTEAATDATVKAGAAKSERRKKKEEEDEFDLSDIKAFSEKMTKEDIVAAAEAAAFAE